MKVCNTIWKHKKTNQVFILRISTLYLYVKYGNMGLLMIKELHLFGYSVSLATVICGGMNEKCSWKPSGYLQWFLGYI